MAEEQLHHGRLAASLPGGSACPAPLTATPLMPLLGWEPLGAAAAAPELWHSCPAAGEAGLPA